MVPFRARLGRLFQNITGGSGEAALATGPTLTKKGDLFYIIILAVVILISIALVYWFSSGALQFLLASLWGLTVGGTLLLYLPPKILITLIGGILGVGASDLVGLAQVVEKMSTTVAAITKTINSSGSVQFQEQAVWWFIVLVAVCCVPAYRSETG